MLRVEIDAHQAASVEIRKGEKNGRAWEMRSQPIWVFQDGAKYPIEINFNLPDGVTHYPAGDYELNVELAIVQGNFNRIHLDDRRLVLTPVEKDSKKTFLDK
jgi:hypothetical protein